MGDTAVNKTTSTLNNPIAAKPADSRQAKWGEDRSVFPIYLALAKQLEIEIPFSAEKRNLPEKPDLELFDEVEAWLDEMDQRVAVHELRKLLQTTTLNANESQLVRADPPSSARNPRKRTWTATKSTSCWCNTSPCAPRRRSTTNRSSLPTSRR